jgi:hypothetical protein
MLDTFLSSRKEVIPSSFPVNQFILEQERCTPFENWKTPFRNSELAALTLNP